MKAASPILWPHRQLVSSAEQRRSLLTLYTEAFPLAERKSEEQLFAPLLAPEWEEQTLRLERQHWIWYTTPESTHLVDAPHPIESKQADSSTSQAQIALTLWEGSWQQAPFAFLEYLAVSRSSRGKQLGSRLLHELQQHYAHLLLEVEPPTPQPSLANRRLNWYQRQGFEILPEPYWMPDLHGAGITPPLLLLFWSAHPESAKHAVCDACFGNWKSLLHTQVYFPCLPQSTGE